MTRAGRLLNEDVMAIDDDYRMPFGKHKGECLGDIPVAYLDWLIGQDWMEEKTDLKERIEQHLQGRSEWQQMGND